MLRGRRKPLHETENKYLTEAAGFYFVPRVLHQLPSVSVLSAPPPSAPIYLSRNVYLLFKTPLRDTATQVESAVAMATHHFP